MESRPSSLRSYSAHPPNAPSHPSSLHQTARQREPSLSSMSYSNELPQDINMEDADNFNSNDRGPDNPNSNSNSSDSDPESDEPTSLAENLKLKKKRRHWKDITNDQHGELYREKAAQSRSVPSQHDQFSIAITHYVKFLLGITRKPCGAQITSASSLPAPPSDEEIQAWLQRKHQDAIKEAETQLKPVQFQSLLSNKRSGCQYSSNVAYSCKAALALAGFT
ncbi:hypothetical protein DFH28DRAFT_1124461 [Melampsora americana]|nr:hypothetical protein DFH28DRAFT_1124461 [Melampsora americana]